MVAMIRGFRYTRVRAAGVTQQIKWNVGFINPTYSLRHETRKGYLKNRSRVGHIQNARARFGIACVSHILR